MTQYLIQEDSLTTLADAVRTSTGTTDTMTIDEMADAINAGTSDFAEKAVQSHNTDTTAHSDIRTALNKKANDYSIEIYNGTSGNPKPVKFLTVNYSTCGSENGVAIKLGMVSGHGNGSSYAFLQDAIIKVGHTGNVSVDNFKYYGADCGTYDGTARQYGDIFWVIDTENKIVDFYVLMGQYARIQTTPYKRVTYSTGGTITQPTSCTVYSSGTKVWANNDEIAVKSDIGNVNLDGYATTDALNALQAQVDELAASVVAVHSGNTVPPSALGEDGDVYLFTE